MYEHVKLFPNEIWKAQLFHPNIKKEVHDNFENTKIVQHISDIGVQA